MKFGKSLLMLAIFGLPLSLGVIILGAWYWTVRVEKRALLPSFGDVPHFALTTEAGRPFTSDSLAGKVSIVDFIFTQCAGECPMMSTKMADLQRTFSDEPHIRFISVSVDPDNDSPSVLSAYGKGYGAIPGTWTFLTGNRNAIEELAKKGFHLGLDIEGAGAIIHSQKFALVDPHGAIRGYYDSDDADAMKALVRDARVLASRIAA